VRSSILAPQRLVGFRGGARALDVKRINHRVQHAKAALLGDLLGQEQRFARQGVDGFVRLDFAEARVLVAGVAEAGDEQPLQRRAAEFVIGGGVITPSPVPPPAGHPLPRESVGQPHVVAAVSDRRC